MFLSWGETSCAVTLLQRAAKKSPGSSYVRRYLASAYRQAGRLEEALAEYESLEKLVANSKAYYQGLVQVGKAKVLVAQEKTEEALACYKKAVALSGVPSTYQEQWQLAYAQLLAKAGRVDEAIEQYQTLEDTTKRSRTKRLARAARKALLAARAKQGKKK
jgi:tetratricopeptide (TPR) repeat protein